jgi:Domain of unknown function (DUF4124)
MHARLARILCLLALLACAPLAHAQQVYHCIGAHGEPEFSGEPCTTPAPVVAGNADLAGHAFGGACAVTPVALRDKITAAFRTRNINLLSGLILWQGIDQSSAETTLRALSVWLREPLAGIAIVTADGPPGISPSGPAPSAASAARAAPTGFEVSTRGDDGSTRDFGVTQMSGCWWLTL